MRLSNTRPAENKLKELRKKSGLTCNQVATLCGKRFETAQLYAWENMKAKVPAEVAISLAKVYGTTVENLYKISRRKVKKKEGET